MVFFGQNLGGWKRGLESVKYLRLAFLMRAVVAARWGLVVCSVRAAVVEGVRWSGGRRVRARLATDGRDIGALLHLLRAKLSMTRNPFRLVVVSTCCLKVKEMIRAEHESLS